MNNLKYTGERLTSGPSILRPLRIENLSRFEFFSQNAGSGTILDLGCGIGEGTEFLISKKGWRVIGVDISFDALITASRECRNNDKYIQMDVQKLAFANHSFDAIISVEVIEHVPDPIAYLYEASRVLRQEGLFMLTTPNQLRSSPTPKSLWPEHLREYNPTQLEGLLRKVFTRVEIWGEFIPQYESHPIRKLVHQLAPFFKPILPHWLRIRALPFLLSTINRDIQLNDVKFSKNNIDTMPTLVAICQN